MAAEALGAEGCRIDFRLHYEFAAGILDRVAGPVFERITNTLVDAFVRRADQLGAAIPRPPWVIPPSLATRRPELDPGGRSNTV